ncbi:glycosyltransferase-like protein [Agrilactobacillus composti DSM 18527 = JCM 14202]|uniref:Glycosyltransferase-like protein n=1 Tax=Agrilactobacillus composti DSM 18527 = JCM 14202 TaxID=1423734 RepID=A0A0R1Y0C2_9LACO|nr:glycosyltransferase-like protein [Agrilactobacillus composti DSM 18527 = JCM 14202]
MYNEEPGIQKTIDVLLNYCQNRPEDYELIFVNDGSTDKTEKIIKEAVVERPEIKLVNFSRNFGHQLAISAGIHYTSGDAVVVMDADLQDPPSIIPSMISKWHHGYDVVYGQRLHREGETFFKKATAGAFYRLLGDVTSINIPLDTGDFRLMDRRVVDVLKRMPETDPFVRGMVSWVGFKQAAVRYDRQERIAGETKYPLSKMLKLATDGLVSFSMVPLKLAQWLGSVLLIGAFVSFIYGIITGFGLGVEIMCLTTLIGGFVLLAIGILGNYIGRIFVQSRARPLYVVSETEGFAKQSSTIKLEDRQRM